MASDRMTLGYQAKWSYKHPDPNEAHLTACYAACRQHLPTFRTVNTAQTEAVFTIANTCNWEKLTSYFHYCPDEITKEKLDWWWENVFLTAIPERVKPFLVIEDGSIFPMQNIGVGYKTITVEFRKVSWDDILTLFTFARTMQEAPDFIGRAYDWAHKFPKCTPDMAFYASSVCQGAYQPAQLLLTTSSNYSDGWSHEEVQKYSFKKRWEGMKALGFMHERRGTNIQAYFMLKGRGNRTNEDSVLEYDHATYKKTFMEEFTRMVA